MNKQKKNDNLLKSHMTEQEIAVCHSMGLSNADFLAEKTKQENQRKAFHKKN